jgi:hypothetical protein
MLREFDGYATLDILMKGTFTYGRMTISNGRRLTDFCLTQGSIVYIQKITCSLARFIVSRCTIDTLSTAQIREIESTGGAFARALQLLERVLLLVPCDWIRDGFRQPRQLGFLLCDTGAAQMYRVVSRLFASRVSRTLKIRKTCFLRNQPDQTRFSA